MITWIICIHHTHMIMEHNIACAALHRQYASDYCRLMSQWWNLWPALLDSHHDALEMLQDTQIWTRTYKGIKLALNRCIGALLASNGNKLNDNYCMPLYTQTTLTFDFDWSVRYVIANIDMFELDWTAISINYELKQPSVLTEVPAVCSNVKRYLIIGSF